jgi:FKBP-type peptidyl-prolyl cis-trans isomerase (trigger factor)
MEQQNTSSRDTIFLTFEHSQPEKTSCRATVIVPHFLVNAFFEETACVLQRHVKAYGFHRGVVPLEYVRKEYHSNIVEHLKEFFCKFGIINFLLHEVMIQKIVIAGDPHLVDIVLDYDCNAQFIFEFSLFSNFELFDWKYLPFKAPARKNYKDLDSQVDRFIQEEKVKLDGFNHQQSLSIGDWVNFDVSVVKSSGEQLHDKFIQNFWLKLGDEEVEGHLRALFIGKNKNEEFIVTNKGLQEHFSGQLSILYNFKIAVKEVVPYAYFCLEQFKDHFRIKSNKDMHKKLIEVFSYRDDVSQRLAMVEDAFKLLLSKHKFFPPMYLIERQQKIILSAIQKNPDYNVYRKQKDFHFWVKQLAEKQVKETLLIDHIICSENITVNNDEVSMYLNLEKRPRMKEFIYFGLPESKRDGEEMPWPKYELSRFCAREKAINHVIYHLTKK